MRNVAGGAATAAGMNFQHCVAAWVAAHILAEKGATPPWGLSAGTTLRRLLCETDGPVDDLVAETSENGLVFIQAKKSVNLSQADNSDLASAIGQFAHQYVACQTGNAGKTPWNRPLGTLTDRFVLVTSASSSRPITSDLAGVLNRIRGLQPTDPLEDAARTSGDRKALRIVTNHVSAALRDALNADPSEDDIRLVLSLTRIQTIDLDVDDAGDREARGLLRTHTVRHPEDADSAWGVLVKTCADLAARRTGMDMYGFRNILVTNGISLQEPVSYQTDIRRLTAHSVAVRRALDDFAQISLGEKTLKIRRPCTQALRLAAEEGSLLVVGGPGAGKSGALHDFAQELSNEARDCIFLAVDRLQAQSLGSLRNELGLEHEFLDVLANWAGSQPGFLIIDALDAARGATSQRMVMDLMRQVMEDCDRWRVVSSIRKFDLRYSFDIRKLFTGQPPTEFQDREFADVRHLNVPHLCDEELSQIASESAQLYSLISRAPEGFRDILRVPFNLRLVAGILDSDTGPDDILSVGTQSELMNRYWLVRVIGSDDQGDAREVVLRCVCEEMIRASTLHAARGAVQAAGPSAAIANLLRHQILIEGPPDRSVLQFSHHVLFDCAVAKLLLAGPPHVLLQRLAADPGSMLMIWPSILLRFCDSWIADDDRSGFWDLVLKVVQSPQIPEIGKLAGPTVAAQSATTMSDLRLLSLTLQDPVEDTRSSAEGALRHLLGALLAEGPDGERLVGPAAGPWCEFFESVSRNPRQSLAYIIRRFLMTICERPERLTAEQRSATGMTARRLLAYAVVQPNRDGRLVIHALQCVCRTYESDPAASADLIRSRLSPQNLTDFGFEEMFCLAREVGRLIEADASLVEEIYRAAFRHREESREPVPLGFSRIMELVSNRQQDYEGALYELAEAFPEFLNRAPENAVRALIAAVNAYVAQRHTLTPEEELEATFYVDERPVRISADYSRIWSTGIAHSEDGPVKMLNEFQRYLTCVAEPPESADILLRLVDTLISGNRLAAIWNRLLIAAAHNPSTLGRCIIPFAWATPILICHDTRNAASEFIRAMHPVVLPSQRELIERCILDFPDNVPQERREAGCRIRGRLLACLAEANLVTEEARLLARQSSAVSANAPGGTGTFTVFEVESSDEEQYLEVPLAEVGSGASSRIEELIGPVKEFASNYPNSTSSPEEGLNVIPALQALRSGISDESAQSVNSNLSTLSWHYLASACACITRIHGLPCDEPSVTFVKDTLLRAGEHELPIYVPDRKHDDSFDELPFWGVPAPRIEAAAGLIHLASSPNDATPDVLAAIEHLSSDPVPAVRFQIARHLHLLHPTAPEMMWRLVESTCRNEPSKCVLQGLVPGTLLQLAKTEPDRTCLLTEAVFERAHAGVGAEEVRALCVHVFAHLALQHQPCCSDVIIAIADNPAAYPKEAHHLVSGLRQAMTSGPVHRPSPDCDAARHRAIDLVSQILISARKGLREIEARHCGRPFSEWPMDDQETIKGLNQLIVLVGKQVYFASGAHGEKAQNTIHKDGPPNLQRDKRFYEEARPVLDELADIGFASVAHDLIKTLGHCVPFDPRGVLIRIGCAVKAAELGHYQFESMAADLVVRIVERYLAEYRTMVQQDSECRETLIYLLGVFASAGWPQAMRLVYRLDQALR